MRTRKNKQATKETASERYDVHKNRILALLKKIEKGLAKDEKEFNGPEGFNRKNWGFVGSLNEWADRLQEVSDAMNQEGEYAPENKA